jgi:excisionase family DNA binding protein
MLIPIGRGQLSVLRIEGENVRQASGSADAIPESSPVTRFLKPEEFAEYLGISLRWIYRHIKDIPHHRVGKYLRFDLESPTLRHWIQSLEEKPQR